MTLALDLSVGDDPGAGRVRDSRSSPWVVSPSGEIFVVWQDARFSQGAWGRICSVVVERRRHDLE